MVLKNFFYNISIYHYTLLFFNLLPIYPLDGGKILNILCGYFFNYLNSFYITMIISIIFLIIIMIYNFCSFNLNMVFMIMMMVKKILNIYKKRYYYYNRFLLERYLHNYSFHKIKNINSINKFYRDRLHFINYKEEKSLLKDYFHE